MQALLSLHLHPVDFGAAALAALFAVALFWMLVRFSVRIGLRAFRFVAKQRRPAWTRMHRFVPASRKCEVEPLRSAVAPSLSPLEQLGMVIQQATATIEQSRLAVQLTGRAVTKLDSIEHELMALLGDIAGVSGYAQRRAAGRDFAQGLLQSVEKPKARALSPLGQRSIAA